MRDTLDVKGARLVALCDVDSKVLDSGAASVESEHGLKLASERDFRRLIERKDIDLAQDRWTIGGKLDFDPMKERYISRNNHQDANQLLRRAYRKGFEVPEKV